MAATPPPIERRRVLALAGALAATASIAGCLGNEDDTDDPDGGDDGGDPSDGSGDGGDTGGDAVDDLVADTTAFALDLHRELVGADPGANLFSSPHSLAVALAMTYAGAAGETESQMEEALGYSLGEDVHGAIADLAAELDDRSEVDAAEGDPFELAVENTVWGQEGYAFQDEYLSLLETHYDAALQELDFPADPEAARQEINDWVAEQTDELIEDLLPEGSLTEYTRLVLTNAISFEASWATQFEEDLTEDAPFTAHGGASTEVPMMRRTDASYPYAAVDGHQVIELPYVGEEVSMVVMLPAAGEFEDFEADLDAERFGTLLDALEPREGELRLPRFSVESGFDLRSVLSDLGMSAAFDPAEADFSGMVDTEETDEDLYLQDVYHEAVVTVEEEGTEAAAASGVVAGTISVPEDPFEMVVDRPFLFAIRDRPTGAVLFLGRVVDAAAAQ